MTIDFINLRHLASKGEQKMNKDMVKKATPIVAGLVIAGIGVLVGLGVLKADVEKVQPMGPGESVTFTAAEGAVMVKATVDVELEGTNYASGPCWIVYGAEPGDIQPPADAPDEPLEPVTPSAE
jgi:hypothetical protein